MQGALTLLPESTRSVAAYACKAKGKGLRPGLVLLCAALAANTLPRLNCAAAPPKQTLALQDKSSNLGKTETNWTAAAPQYLLAAAVEFIHIASLLHDDIEDEAHLRRGQESAHMVFGTRGALIAGDALLALGMNLAANCAPLNQQLPKDALSAKLVSCLSQGLLETVCGQIKDLEGHDNLDAYLLAATGKTASLMAAACQGGALLADVEDVVAQSFKNFGLNLGIAYQLLDDWLDFAPSLRTGKTRGADLSAGKLNLPLYFYITTLPQKEQNDFLQKIKNKAFDDTQKNKIIENILSKDLTAQIRRLIAAYTGKAENSLLHLPACLEKEVLLSLAQAIGNLCPE